MRMLLALGLLVAWASASPQVAAATPEELQACRSRLADGVLVWSADAEGGAPFVVRSPEDPSELTGLEVELAAALSRELSDLLGQPMRDQMEQYEWVSLPAGLLKGDFDVILNGFEDSPDNRTKFLLSRPYCIYGQQLVVRRQEDRVGRLADCLGLSVGTLGGSASEQLLQAAGVRDISAYDGQVEPYLDLEQGRLDAVLLDSPIALFYAAPNPALKLVGEPFHLGGYVIAARPDDTALVAVLDECLARLIRSGELLAILRKWRLWNGDQAALAQERDRAAELAGLGFDEHGQPLPSDAGAQVDAQLVAAAAAQWTFDKYAPLLLLASLTTIGLTLASMLCAVLLGLVIAVARLYGPPPIRWLALMYVEFLRGVPILLVLFFLYYALPNYGVALPAWGAAILGFGLNYAAYESEIYRSSIQAVPLGQWEAARALGMPDVLAFRRVILPQAIRTALGPMTNDFVALFKDTSLVSVIAVQELTKEYLILARSSLKFVELGLLTAALYLAMSVPLGHLSRRLERRWGPGK